VDVGVKVGARSDGGPSQGGLGSNQFFLMGILVGSAAGLALGSALGFELRPENIKALRKLMRRMSGQENHPHYESMV
jgi:hypothetical protein